MAQDKLDSLGPLMNDIGQELAAIAGGDPEGLFLYVEIGEGWISPYLFKEDQDVVRYLDFDDPALDDLLFEAWYSEPEGKRWSVMTYEIKDRRFAVTFRYPDEVDVESMDHDHREDALRARYGEKPVIYPPIPEGAIELTPEE